MKYMLGRSFLKVSNSLNHLCWCISHILNSSASPYPFCLNLGSRSSEMKFLSFTTLKHPVCSAVPTSASVSVSWVLFWPRIAQYLWDSSFVSLQDWKRYQWSNTSLIRQYYCITACESCWQLHSVSVKHKSSVC